MRPRCNRVEHSQEGDHLAACTKLAGHLERDNPTHRVPGQVVGSARLRCEDLGRVVAGHLFERPVWLARSVEAARLDTIDRETGGEMSHEVHVVEQGSTARMNEKEALGSLAGAKPDQQRPAGVFEAQGRREMLDGGLLKDRGQWHFASEVALDLDEQPQCQ